MGERMTFDARKGNNAPASGKQNALFAAMTLAVVCGAFFTVLGLPHGDRAPKRAPVPKVERLAALEAPSLPRLPGEQAEAYYLALGKADPKAQAELSARIAKAGRIENDALAELIFDHAGNVLQAHAGELAMADTGYFDDLLDLARDRLRMASHKRSKWCEASRYAELQAIEFSDPAQVKRELAEFQAPVRDFSFEALAILMAAAEGGRDNPVVRGDLTRTDEAALQGMLMSLMTDPDVMPLMMSMQSGADSKQALKGVNVCNLAATAVSAVKTLPQDTKGRLMAEAMRNMEKNGPAAFTTVAGF